MPKGKDIVDEISWVSPYFPNGFLNTKMYDFKDKSRCLEYYLRYFFSRTFMMFDYEGLPDTLSKTELERQIQVRGHTTIFKLGDKFYSSYGYLGGELNEYYLPKLSIVSNPWIKELNGSKTFTIGEDCVVMRNDDWYTGLMPLNRKYASLLVENDITLRLIDINQRATFIAAANDTNTADSAQLFYDKLEAGEGFVIRKTDKINISGDENLSILPTLGASSTLSTKANEHHQYILSLWWQELGINSNYNMKRETLTSSEVGINENQLIPLVSNMLYNRQKACEELNKMFGLNITVQISGVWKDIKEELEMTNEMMRAEIDNKKAETESIEKGVEENAINAGSNEEIQPESSGDDGSSGESNLPENDDKDSES